MLVERHRGGKARSNGEPRNSGRRANQGGSRFSILEKEDGLNQDVFSGQVEDMPKVGPKILKPINSNGETSGLNQKKFDDGSSMAHDKVDKVIDVGGFNPVQISNHLNAKNHQAIQVGGIEQSVWKKPPDSSFVDLEIEIVDVEVEVAMEEIVGGLDRDPASISLQVDTTMVTEQFGDLWLIADDFNSILDGLDRIEGASISQRLDRAICNSEWDSFAPNCLVHNLYRLESNHKPVLVSFKPEPTKGYRPFRCLDSYMLHVDFKGFVKQH
ncbi:hypothetical protein Godav_015040 [Gossypium davidsonii]|uniref:Endonuclease/exonuclease/phosphatase domain-containing protein n=1 Tax=Gossypium davidsonii TaxID=34287 RepID=A0A7J8RLT2_GOSDV|nr:hypothetical protein [Gossypium davidsonii]